MASLYSQFCFLSDEISESAGIRNLYFDKLLHFSNLLTGTEQEHRGKLCSISSKDEC